MGLAEAHGMEDKKVDSANVRRSMVSTSLLHRHGTVMALKGIPITCRHPWLCEPHHTQWNKNTCKVHVPTKRVLDHCNKGLYKISLLAGSACTDFHHGTGVHFFMMKLCAKNARIHGAWHTIADSDQRSPHHDC